MAKIGIIVPIYKVEKYLRQCVDSILVQTYADYELILVDDGSPDDSGSICDEYADEYPFIHVIHQKNKGLSAARNSGLEWLQKNSNAEYVTFIDSDDWVSPNYLSELIKAIERYNSEISISGFYSFKDGEEIEMNLSHEYSIKCVSGREACIQYYQMKWTIPIAACAKMYKIDLFSDIRFPEGKVYEDQGTIPKLWYMAKRIALIQNSSLYAYRILRNSISHAKFSSRKFEDVWNVQQCIHFFEQKGDLDLVKLCLKFRDVLQAKYIILAYHYYLTDQIPDEYQMTTWKALRILKKGVNYQNFTWYLSLIHPRWIKLYSYVKKVEEILGVSKTER